MNLNLVRIRTGSERRQHWPSEKGICPLKRLDELWWPPNWWIISSPVPILGQKLEESLASWLFFPEMGQLLVPKDHVVSPSWCNTLGQMGCCTRPWPHPLNSCSSSKVAAQCDLLWDSPPLSPCWCGHPLRPQCLISMDRERKWHSFRPS